MLSYLLLLLLPVTGVEEEEKIPSYDVVQLQTG